MLARVFFIAAVVAGAGCSVVQRPCEAGESTACVGEGGCAGRRTCGADGGLVAECRCDAPDAALRPPVLGLDADGGLDFGRLAVFPNAASGPAATRSLGVRNLATAGAGPLTVQWRVEPSNAGEVCVGRFDEAAAKCLGVAGDALTLEPGAKAELPIRLQPTSAGPGAWTLVLLTDDPQALEHRLALTVEGLTLPPCALSVTPAALDFGVLSPRAATSQTFELRNLGTQPGETCLLTDFAVEPTSDAAFALKDGPVGQKVLQPGEAWNVEVRAAPQAFPLVPGVVAGRVSFTVSTPTSPRQGVALAGSFEESCLHLSTAPSELDFGSVPSGCSSADRAFQLVSSCAPGAAVESAELTSAAGQPAGGPNCPGTVACPEFHLVAAPPLASSPAGSTTTFAVKYRPLDVGGDQGALRLKVGQGGQHAEFLVGMRGEGSASHVQVDRYTMPPKPGVDVLLVLDDSPAMADQRASLETNLDMFLRTVTGNPYDFRVGITTTDPARHGTLRESSGGVKVFTRQTADLANAFREAARVGSSGSSLGSCIDAAVAALTGPTAARGFVRAEAPLYVVCVTNGLEHSERPLGESLEALRALKPPRQPEWLHYEVVGPFSTSANCAYASQADDGRHAWLVEQTNGVKEDICTRNWAWAIPGFVMFEGWGFPFQSLSARPASVDGGGLVVRINGVELPADRAPGLRNWQWDEATNLVRFEMLAAPQPDDVVTFTYAVVCGT